MTDDTPDYTDALTEEQLAEQLAGYMRETMDQATLNGSDFILLMGIKADGEVELHIDMQPHQLLDVLMTVTQAIHRKELIPSNVPGDNSELMPRAAAALGIDNDELQAFLAELEKDGVSGMEAVGLIQEFINEKSDPHPAEKVANQN